MLRTAATIGILMLAARALAQPAAPTPRLTVRSPGLALAYNLKRVMQILGAGPLIAAIRT